MQLPQIRLQSQMAQIDIQQTSGKQLIRQTHADLSIEQPKAITSLRTTPAKLTIDQTQAWEDMNIRSALSQTRKNAGEGYQSARKGVSRRARQGDELMKIESGGDPIVNQAITNGHRQQKEIGLTYIPSPFAVKINYQPGSIDFNVQTNRPMIHARSHKPEMNFQRGTVNIEMKRYQDLQMDVENV